METYRVSARRTGGPVAKCPGLIISASDSEYDYQKYDMTPGKILMRAVFVVCMLLILSSDYSGLLNQLLKGNRTVSSSHEPSRPPPRPTNPGYGDTKTEIDLDADIEDETIKSIGQYGKLNKPCNVKHVKVLIVPADIPLLTFKLHMVIYKQFHLNP